MPLYLQCAYRQTGPPCHGQRLSRKARLRMDRLYFPLSRPHRHLLPTILPHHQRKQIYAADIVYGTASEFGFDYLRDNSMAHAQR